MAQTRTVTHNGQSAKPANPGTDYKINLSPEANDRFDVIMLKWTLTNPDLLHSELRQQERGSDREIDVAHQIAAIKKGFVELTTTGRARAGRVDTGEELIRTHNCATAFSTFDQLGDNGFVLVDAHFYMRPAQGKHGKDKYTVVCVFARDNGELTSFEPSAELMVWLHDLAETTFQSLHVWGNPDGTCTWNYGGRTPDQEAKFDARIEDSRMGVYAHVYD